MGNQSRWVNPLLWTMALVIINVLWANVSQQSAPNEINAADRFESYRDLDISPVFGSEKALPATFSVSFESTSLDQANVSYRILFENDTEIASWSGMLTDDVPVWEGSLEPGAYVIETVVDDGVQAEQTLALKPFATVQTVGHITMSLLLVVLAVVERGIRTWWGNQERKEVEKTEEKAPFKSKRFSVEENQEWNDDSSPWRDPIR